MAAALEDELGATSLTLIGRRDGVSGLPEGVPSSRLTGGGYPGWLQTTASRDVKRMRADIAHYSQGMVPLVRATPTVLSVHDMSLVRLWKTHPLRRLLQIPLVLLSPRLADIVMVPSRATADEVMRLTGVTAAKIEVIPYAAQHELRRDRCSDSAGCSVTAPAYPTQLHLGAGNDRATKESRSSHRGIRARGAYPPDSGRYGACVRRWHWVGMPPRSSSGCGISQVAERIRRLGYVPSDDLLAAHVAGRGRRLRVAVRRFWPAGRRGHGVRSSDGHVQHLIDARGRRGCRFPG